MSETFEAKLKSLGLMALAEKISRQPSVGSVTWFLVVTLVQIYKEKEQVEQGKIHNVQFEEKMSTRKYNGAKFSAKEDLKKKV